MTWDVDGAIVGVGCASDPLGRSDASGRPGSAATSLCARICTNGAESAESEFNLINQSTGHAMEDASVRSASSMSLASYIKNSFYG